MPRYLSINGRTVEEYSPDGYSRVRIVDVGYEYNYVVEPVALTQEELTQLEDVMDRLSYEVEPRGLLRAEVLEKYLRDWGLSDRVVYTVLSQVIGYSWLEPLMRDEYLEDIQCFKSDLPLRVTHRSYGLVNTNIVPSGEEVDRMVRLLAYRGGSSVSVFRAREDSVILPTGDRCALTFRSEISPTSSFTIRKFPRRPWTPTKMIRTGMVTPEAMALLWLCIDAKLPIMVFGAMGTGKTSFINALAMLIRPDASITLVQDAPEMRIFHENVLSLYERKSTTAGETGRVTLEDLLAHALRRSVDYVSVNEVRSRREVYSFAQAVALGHGGLCLPYDQLVPMIVDGKAGIYKIGEIVEKALRGEVGEICVLAWNGEKAIWAPVSRVVKKRGSKRFLRIKLEGGVEFEVHEEHPIIVYKNGFLIRKKASEVEKGDLIPVLKYIPMLEPRMEYLDVIEVLGGRYGEKLYVEGAEALLKEIDYKKLRELLPDVNYHTMWDWWRRNAAMPLSHYLKIEPSKSYRYRIRVKYGAKGRRSIPAVLRLDRDFGYVIGLFLADGSLAYDEKDSLPTKTVFYVRAEDVSEVIERLKRIGLPEEAIGVSRTESAKAKAVRVYSKVFALLLYHILNGRVRDYNRTVPLNIALRAPEEFRKGLLEGYWSGDGSLVRVGVNALRALASTVNKELGHSVALVGKTLDIHIIIKTTLNDGGFSSRSSRVYCLQVAGADSLKNFLKAIDWRDRVDVKGRGRLRYSDGLILCRVISVEEVEKNSALYDFEVPTYHNFAICGNCVLTSNTSIHTDSIEGIFARLKGYGVEEPLAENIKVVVGTGLFLAEREGRRVRLRRVRGIYFVKKLEDYRPVYDVLYEYDPSRDTLVEKNNSIVDYLADRLYITPSDLHREWKKRTTFLELSFKAGVFEGDELFPLLKEFRHDPQGTIEKLKAMTMKAKPVPEEKYLVIASMEEVKYCPHCGYQLPARARSCPKCGFVLIPRIPKGEVEKLLLELEEKRGGKVEREEEGEGEEGKWVEV